MQVIKESSTLPSSKKKCRVSVVLTAPTVRDSFHDTVKRGSGAVKHPSTRTSPRLHPSSTDSKPKPVKVRKNKKKLKFKVTARERRRNMTSLQDYNLNHEDDYFEGVDPPSLPAKILLNSSVSSSDSSSPSLSRRASPLASFLPKLTRETTPLQFRGVLHRNKDESIDSGNR